MLFSHSLFGFVNYTIKKGLKLRSLHSFLFCIFLLKIYFYPRRIHLLKFFFIIIEKIRPRIGYHIIKFKPRIRYGPLPLTFKRSCNYAFFWIIKSARKRTGYLVTNLFVELLLCHFGLSHVIKLRSETHLLAYSYKRNLFRKRNRFELENRNIRRRTRRLISYYSNLKKIKFHIYLLGYFKRILGLFTSFEKKHLEYVKSNKLRLKKPFTELVNPIYKHIDFSDLIQEGLYSLEDYEYFLRKSNKSIIASLKPKLSRFVFFLKIKLRWKQKRKKETFTKKYKCLYYKKFLKHFFKSQRNLRRNKRYAIFALNRITANYSRIWNVKNWKLNEVKMQRLPKQHRVIIEKQLRKFYGYNVFVKQRSLLKNLIKTLRTIHWRIHDFWNYHDFYFKNHLQRIEEAYSEKGRKPFKKTSIASFLESFYDPYRYHPRRRVRKIFKKKWRRSVRTFSSRYKPYRMKYIRTLAASWRMDRFDPSICFFSHPIAGKYRLKRFMFPYSKTLSVKKWPFFVSPLWQKKRFRKKIKNFKQLRFFVKKDLFHMRNITKNVTRNYIYRFNLIKGIKKKQRKKTKFKKKDRIDIYMKQKLRKRKKLKKKVIIKKPKSAKPILWNKEFASRLLNHPTISLDRYKKYLYIKKLWNKWWKKKKKLLLKKRRRIKLTNYLFRDFVKYRKIPKHSKKLPYYQPIVRITKKGRRKKRRSFKRFKTRSFKTRSYILNRRGRVRYISRYANGFLSNLIPLPFKEREQRKRNWRLINSPRPIRYRRFYKKTLLKLRRKLRKKKKKWFRFVWKMVWISMLRNVMYKGINWSYWKFLAFHKRTLKKRKKVSRLLIYWFLRYVVDTLEYRLLKIYDLLSLIINYTKTRSRLSSVFKFKRRFKVLAKIFRRVLFLKYYIDVYLSYLI